MSEIILGIDVGGTGIKGALVDINKGQLVTDRIKIKTPRPANPEAVLATANELIDRFDWRGKEIGMGFPCIVKSGMCLSANNISKDWIGINLIDHFEKGTGSKLSILNDADAAGVAEAHFGAGRNHKGLMILITIGTGIGSGFIYNGKLIPNIELGSINWKESIVEKYVSNKARKDNELSWEVWGTELGNFFNHVLKIYSPDLIVLGGGVSKHFTHYQPYFNLTREVAITTAEHLNGAGVLGAALYRSLNRGQA